jgi:hypothetical protein
MTCGVGFRVWHLSDDCAGYRGFPKVMNSLSLKNDWDQFFLNRSEFYFAPDFDHVFRMPFSK